MKLWKVVKDNDLDTLKVGDTTFKLPLPFGVNTMLDSNTHYLNQYEINSVLLDQQWELDLPNKREAVIEYAKKIMEGFVSKEEFTYVFAEFYEDSDFDGDTYVDGFNEALDNWNLGIAPSDELEYDMLWSIVHSALDGASQINYDSSFEDLFDNLGKAIKSIMGS